MEDTSKEMIALCDCEEIQNKINEFDNHYTVCSLCGFLSMGGNATHKCGKHFEGNGPFIRIPTLSHLWEMAMGSAGNYRYHFSLNCLSNDKNSFSVYCNGEYFRGTTPHQALVAFIKEFRS